MKKRTENEILKDFEKLGYRIEKNKSKYNNSGNSISLLRDYKFHDDDDRILTAEIYIDLEDKTYIFKEINYESPLSFTMYEHKLLNELFELWGWQ